MKSRKNSDLLIDLLIENNTESTIMHISSVIIYSTLRYRLRNARKKERGEKRNAAYLQIRRKLKPICPVHIRFC